MYKVYNTFTWKEIYTRTFFSKVDNFYLVCISFPILELFVKSIRENCAGCFSKGEGRAVTPHVVGHPLDVPRNG